jgi:L-amino acid N-acyltransferase YncA
MTQHIPHATVETLQIGGREVTLRFMTEDDADLALSFASSLPQHDIVFLHRDITQAAGIAAWLADIEQGLEGVILAVAGDAVVGYSSVSRSPLSWSRHVAELRVVVGPDARGQGLGRALTAEAFRIAEDLGVRKMVAQMTIDQQGALHTFKRLGFTSEALLHDQVLDADGTTLDLVVMSQDVAAFAHTLAHLED